MHFDSCFSDNNCSIVYIDTPGLCSYFVQNENSNSTHEQIYRQYEEMNTFHHAYIERTLLIRKHLRIFRYIIDIDHLKENKQRSH